MKLLMHPSRTGEFVFCIILTVIVVSTLIVCSVSAGDEVETVDDVQKAISSIVDKYPGHSLYKKKFMQLEFATDIHQASVEKSVPPLLITSMAFHENSLKLKSETGPAGEIGPIQVHPETAKHHKCDTKTRIGLIRCGAGILRTKYEMCGNWPEALAAYASRSGKCSAIKKRGPRRAARFRVRTWEKFKELKWQR